MKYFYSSLIILSRTVLLELDGVDLNCCIEKDLK